VTTNERDIVFWDCDDNTERLRHMDQFEAIIDALVGRMVPGMTPERVLSTLRDAFGETITVYGFARMAMPTLERFLDMLMDWLNNDLELGDLNGADPPSDGLKAAARVFHEAMLSEYEPWGCEIVTKEEVNIEQWIRENEPEWLEP